MLNIRPRLRITPVLAVGLALGLGAVSFIIVCVDLLMSSTRVPDPGGVAPITYRIPEAGFYEDFKVKPTHKVGPFQVNKGSRLNVRQVEMLRALEEHRRPPGLAFSVGLSLLLAALLLGLTTGLRLLSTRGHHLRVHLVALVTVLLLLIGAKAFMVLTSLPTLWFPIAAVALAFSRALDRPSGIALGLGSAAVLAVANGMDANMMAVLGAECAAACLVAGSTRDRLPVSIASAAAAAAGLVLYLSHRLLVSGLLPATDTSEMLGSNLVAIMGAGLLTGILTYGLEPTFRWALGEVSRNTLLKLSDFGNPLLQKVENRAPGTWQHTLAMANMAEVVANKLKCNATQARVGALYHDIGKSLMPDYFAENLMGRPSPHEDMKPEVSADAIVAHVIDGVRMAREAGLPTPIIDFIHMHHGNTVLQFFWDKNVKQGNPQGLGPDDFRYPGLPPQTKETGILAIVDAVEAASRTLKQPDKNQIEALVRQIVFSKLTEGQLDNTGLDMAELSKMASALAEILESQYHVRPEYPWQQAATEKIQRVEAVTESDPEPEAQARGGPKENGPVELQVELEANHQAETGPTEQESSSEPEEAPLELTTKKDANS